MMKQPGRRNLLQTFAAGIAGALAAGPVLGTAQAHQGRDHPGADPQAILARALEQARALLMQNPNMRPDYIAGGYIYLAGMLEFHVMRHLKGGDPDRPCFVRDMESHRNWGLPTPNHHYYSAQIDGSGVYRILGQRGNVADYCFEVLSGLAGDDGVIGDRIDAMEASNLKIGPDGRFEIVVGGEPRANNWLKAGRKARAIFVRQTVNDWVAEQPTPMFIERLDLDPEAMGFEPLTMDEVREVYRQAAKGLVDQVGFLNDFAANWKKTLDLNSLSTPSVGPADAGYFPGQFNTKCRWEIGDGEVLLITLKEPDCAYQSLDLAHPVWFNSIYPREITSSLTGAQSRVSSDGLMRFVIGVADPGVPNWLNSGGLREGFLFLRWQGVEGRPPQKPEMKRVDVADIRAHFPANEPIVSAAERAAAAHLRRLTMDKRYF